MTDTGVCQINEPPGNASILHDHAGQNKKRDGQQRKFGNSGVEYAGKHGDTKPGIEHAHDGSQPHSRCDRHSQAQQHKKYAD